MKTLEMRFSFRLVLLASVCLCAGPGRAETWTNQVGRTLEAELVDGTERSLVFKRADGSKLRMPMSTLKAEDQSRAKAFLRRTGALPPEKPKPAPGDALAQRAQRLKEAGALTAAQAARVQEALKKP